MKKLLFFSTFLFYLNFANFIVAQNDFSSHTLFSSVGFTVADANTASIAATGFSFGVGYQRDILSNFTTNRLRFVPSLSFGKYRNTIFHSPEGHFSSYNLKTNFNFDAIRIKSFSFFIGTGITLNYMNGYIGRDGYPDDPADRRENYSFDETNFAINGMFGFRLNPKGKRLGYELKLVDFSSLPNKNGNTIEVILLDVRLLYHLK